MHINLSCCFSPPHTGHHDFQQCQMVQGILLFGIVPIVLQSISNIFTSSLARLDKKILILDDFDKLAHPNWNFFEEGACLV